MSINTSVNGNPSECHAAARRLRRLATALDASNEMLAQRSHLPAAEFGGLSGDAFRRRISALAGGATNAGADTAGLARALELLGRRLDDVLLLMGKARRAARASLVVDGQVIHRPGPCADAHDHLVFDTVSRVVDGVRRLEQQAQLEWQEAVSTYADTDPPAPPVSPPLPLSTSPAPNDGPLDNLFQGNGTATPPPVPSPDPAPLPAPDPIQAEAPLPSSSEVPSSGTGPPVTTGGAHAPSGPGTGAGPSAGSGTWAAEEMGESRAEEVTEPLTATCGNFPGPHFELWEVAR